MSTAKPVNPLPKWLTKVTPELAARGQLESAIFLWFLEADPASIHTLSVAAQGVLNAIGRPRGTKSQAVEWINLQSRSFRDRVRDAQNFFKHGRHHQRDKAVFIYAPFMAEVFMMDAVTHFYRLYESLTPIMILFALRFSLAHPNVLLPHGFPAHLLKGVRIDQLAKLDRSEFLKELLPRIVAAVQGA